MKVSVIGLGYVGSVAAAGLASAGHHVLGVDIDAEKCQAYRNGAVPTVEPESFELVQDGIGRGNMRFMRNDHVSESLGDMIMGAPGTPTHETGAVDLSQVCSALDSAHMLRSGFEYGGVGRGQAYWSRAPTEISVQPC